MIAAQVSRHIQKHFIHRIDVNILRGQIFHINAVNAGAEFHIMGHPRRCNNVGQGHGRILPQPQIIGAGADKASTRRLLSPLRIDFVNTFYHLK